MNTNQQTSQNGSYQNGTNPNGQQNGNNYGNTNSGNYTPKAVPGRRKSTATVIVSIALILMGTSFIVNKFLPWVFDWLDSGLVIACIAIVAGFALLVKK